MKNKFEAGHCIDHHAQENVRDSKYAIARYLYLYTVNTPCGILKQFFDWAHRTNSLVQATFGTGVA